MLGQSRRPAGARASTDGLEVETGFLDNRGPLFVAFHKPHRSRRPAGTVVVCSTIGWELEKNYRREVMLGRSLAMQGFAVLRFHYRGLGESGGQFSQLTLASMVADAQHAFEATGGIERCSAPAVVGIRVGALVAAAFSRSLGGTPLVLWDPVVNGQEYLRQLSQVRQVWSVSHDGGAAPPGPDLDGSLDILGYRLSPRLIRDLRGARLEELVLPASAGTLWLHIGAATARAREVFARLHNRGDGTAPAEAETVPGRVEWWLERRAFESAEGSALSAALVNRTTQWLASRTKDSATEPRILAVKQSADFGSVRRHAVAVPAGAETLSGIFAEPSAGRTDVAAVLLNCGGYHLTSGPVGLWSRLSDRLAEYGIPSLRIAYRGVADSTGRIEDFDLTQPGGRDLDAARIMLANAGFRRHVLIGGCFGARTICSARLDDVIGLGLVSLPVHVESLGRSLDLRKASASSRQAGQPLPWLNLGLVKDLGRCVAAGVPIRVVYARGEAYRRNFDEAIGGDLGTAVRGAGSRFQVALVDGTDSMLEAGSVVDAVGEFVADLVRPSTM